MLTTLRTLFDGEKARAELRVRDAYAVELIDQKIREAEATLSAAKRTLASLIQRQRNEARLLETLEARIATLTTRASEALEAGRDDLAGDAAQAIADMENEQTTRRETLSRLDRRIVQLRASVEAAHRRIVDLKQGAITARAIKREQAMQSRLGKTLAGTNAADEAAALIARVVDGDDPFEASEILSEIDRGLTHTDAAERLAEEGFGTPSRATAASVIARLKRDT